MTNVLFVDGQSGGAERTVELSEGRSLDVSIQRPVAGGPGRFVLHGNEGEPGAATESLLPADIGIACFPFLLSNGAAPVVVANNIGREALVGSSHFYGAASPDPSVASTTLDYPDFPIGTVLTFQAVILDPGSASARGASATNAIVVRWMP